MTDSGTPRRGSVLARVVGVVLVVAIAFAVVVVVRNARRVMPPEPPVSIGVTDADTTLVRFPRTMRGRLNRLESRFARYRDTVPELTGTQDSLARVCAAEFEEVRRELAVLDTLHGSKPRIRAARAIRESYNELRDAVNAFTKTALELVPEPDLDSLDLELHRLLSE